MQQETLERAQIEAVDHETVVQDLRPGAIVEEPEQPEEKTVRVRLRILEAATVIRHGASLLLGKNPTPRSRPRPKLPLRAVPKAPPDIVYGGIRWAEGELELAKDLPEKMSIVEQMTIGSETELARALHLLNRSCEPFEAALLQSLLAMGIKDWAIPLSATAKILSIPRASDVQRLLIDALEKAKPSEDVLFGIMAVWKDKKTLSYVMTYLGLGFTSCAPAPEESAYLTLEKMKKAFDSELGIKLGNHLGLAHALKPDPKSQKSPLEQASEIVERIQDPEAIRVAFRSLGIEITEV